MALAQPWNSGASSAASKPSLKMGFSPVVDFAHATEKLSYVTLVIKISTFRSPSTTQNQLFNSPTSTYTQNHCLPAPPLIASSKDVLPSVPLLTRPVGFPCPPGPGSTTARAAR